MHDITIVIRIVVIVLFFKIMTRIMYKITVYWLDVVIYSL
jgi:hypothetical protein